MDYFLATLQTRRLLGFSSFAFLDLWDFVASRGLAWEWSPAGRLDFPYGLQESPGEAFHVKSTLFFNNRLPFLQEMLYM